VFNKEEDKWEYKETPVIKDEESLLKEKTEKQKLEESIRELMRYLTSTDYKIIKALERGEPIDAQLKLKRQEARGGIRNLRDKLSQIEEA
jgi:hypothetical protein